MEQGPDELSEREGERDSQLESITNQPLNRDDDNKTKDEGEDDEATERTENQQGE